MKYYAGLDVSMEETSICVMDERGRIVKEAVAGSNAGSIGEVLSRFSSCLDRVGLETGPISNWLYDGLRDLGYGAVVIDASHAAAMLKGGFRNKTDRNDARGLADMMRVGKYRAVWVKSAPGQQSRALLTARDQLVGTQTALVNAVRGLLRGCGIKVEANGAGFLAAARCAVAEDGALAGIVEPLLDSLAAVEAGLARHDALIAGFARRDDVCRLLMTCPGVGPVTAFAFRALIEDPCRFRRSRDVGAYFGLTARRYQSGQIDYSGRISRMGDASMRRLLYLAAMTIMRGGPRDPLSAWALRLSKRRGAKRARVALARKLAVVLHRMWLDNASYDAGALKAAA